MMEETSRSVGGSTLGLAVDTRANNGPAHAFKWVEECDLYFLRHGVKVNCICPDPMNTPLWWGISSFCKTQEGCTAMALEYDKRVLPVEHVAKGIVKILEDDKNGTALTALHGQALKYFEFPN